MTLTSKHQKVITLASARNGCPSDLYWNEANELRVAGLIERREHISAVGARSLRWFNVRKDG